MTPLLRLGTARVDITPQQPIPLAGFAHRSGDFERIHSRLFLRAFLFAQDEASALLISADLFCWGPDLYESVLRRLDLPPESIILHATHNHSGPQTSHLFSPSLGAADDRYLEFLQDAVVRAAESARANLEPVTVERGSGRCGFGIYRRKLVDGVIRMAPNLDGPVDPELTAIRFRSLDGAPKAVLVHYTCHPTTSGANEVCAEYPGLAMSALEEDVPVAAFLQGCCGDIRPALIRDGEFYHGEASDAAALAEELVSETRRVLRGAMAPRAPCPLVVSRGTTRLPLETAPGIEELQRLRDTPGIIGEWSRLLLADPARLAWPAVLESTRLDLAHGFGLLSFNAEMVVSYGLYAKEVSGGTLLPIGYSNGMIGYVPTMQQIAEGGYESAEAFRYYGFPAALNPDAEAAVRFSIGNLISYVNTDVSKK